MSWSDNPLDYDMPTLYPASAEDTKFNSETLIDLYISGMLTDEEFDDLTRENREMH